MQHLYSPSPPSAFLGRPYLSRNVYTCRPGVIADFEERMFFTIRPCVLEKS